eukprot:CAMPEP_0176337948 /NCGR_PEP_ID=MMETSP0121_2-20121125/79890_1 /TAXON_ID=160619 /ORGANISM="Kryptoperidinium foliaceum, Strain CCMP 1326" /LENGTH=280 /DNA_ID=CAMNT_0017680963 /DNA_START=113 /DNA_END=954 /DNA_ORIENTATION=-
MGENPKPNEGNGGAILMHADGERSLSLSDFDGCSAERESPDPHTLFAAELEARGPSPRAREEAPPTPKARPVNGWGLMRPPWIASVQGQEARVAGCRTPQDPSDNNVASNGNEQHEAAHRQAEHCDDARNPESPSTEATRAAFVVLDGTMRFASRDGVPMSSSRKARRTVCPSTMPCVDAASANDDVVGVRLVAVEAALLTSPPTSRRDPAVVMAASAMPAPAAPKPPRPAQAAKGAAASRSRRNATPDAPRPCSRAMPIAAAAARMPTRPAGAMGRIGR